MKRKFLASLALVLSFNAAATGNVSAAEMALAAENRVRQTALVIDADNDKVLIDHGANKKVYPASLTKLMTLYLTFEALENGTLKIYQKLPVPAHAAKFQSLHLKAGDTMTVEQAITGLTVKSANDAAIVLAEALAGTDKKFAKMMNTKAKKLGMNSTHFMNPNGLPDPQQVTTAKDIVTLSRAHLRDFPQYSKYFEKKEFVFQGVTYPNHNALMNTMPEIDFGKTGYINASGFNLAVSAKREGKRLFAAVFGGKTAAVRDKKMEGLLNDGFDKALHPPPVAEKPVAPAKKANKQGVG